MDDGNLMKSFFEFADEIFKRVHQVGVPVRNPVTDFLIIDGYEFCKNPSFGKRREDANDLFKVKPLIKEQCMYFGQRHYHVALKAQKGRTIPVISDTESGCWVLNVYHQRENRQIFLAGLMVATSNITFIAIYGNHPASA